MTRLTLYSRAGCHLCDEMKAVVDRVSRTVPLTCDVIDIGGNEELEAAYGLEIPVLLVNGKKAAKYRVAEADLLRRLLAGGPGESNRSGGSRDDGQPA